MRRFLCALVALSGVLPTAHAEEFPPVSVFSDGDDEIAEACGVSGASIVAAVESEFRHNRIPIAAANDQFGPGTINAFIYFVAGDITGAGGCAIAYNLELYHRQSIYDALKKKERMATIEDCHDGGLIWGPSAGLQTRVNDQYRNSVNICISRYLKE
jgi:hypothetical protein